MLRWFSPNMLSMDLRLSSGCIATVLKDVERWESVLVFLLIQLVIIISTKGIER